jgi:hypothetical protein
MADVITGDTQLGATKNEAIESLVQRELKAKSILSGFVTDVSRFAITRRKSIEFPKLESFTPINRTEGAAGDAATLVATTDKLDLNQNAYVAWIVDSMSEVQSSIDSQLEYAKRAASGHGRYVDSQIIATANAEAGYSENVGGGGTITYNSILNMREYVLKNEGMLERMGLFVSVAQEKELFKLTEFKQADVFGQATLPSGVIGSILGMPVIRHNLLADGEAFVWDSEGIALGFQRGASMSEQGANEYGSNAVRKAMDQLFGVKGLQIEQGTAAANRSALIAKLNGALA